MANRTKRTPKKAAKFLAALRRTGNISRSCRAEGIGRRTAYEWREADSDFARQWDEAIEEGMDNLEQEAYRRAYKGTLKPIYYQGDKCGSVREYSDTLTIFLLKAGRPEKYRERFEHDHKGKIGLTFAELAAAASTNEEQDAGNRNSSAQPE